MTILDPIGASLSLLSTFCFVNAKRAAWIVGMLAILVNTTLYFFKGLYGQVALEGVYMVSMVYGLVLWTSSQNENKPTLLISRLTPTHGIGLAVLNIVGVTVAWWLLSHFLNSTVPMLDALILCLSLTAQWLLCRKVFECWIVWFVVDAIVVWVHAQKGIPFHSGVHFIYLFLAVAGHFRWKKLMAAESPTTIVSSDEGFAHSV